MNNKIFNPVTMMVCAGVSVLAVTTSIFLVSQKKSLAVRIVNSQAMLKKMQEGLDSAKAEAEQTLQEKEKLQADTISYIGVNTNLQREKEEAEKKLQAALEIIASKEHELEESAKKLKEAGKKLAKRDSAQIGKLEGAQQEKEELLAKANLLEGTLKKERALYNYNLAVAYTQAKLYDDAVDAYNKSLEYNPDNAEAYYNLGLLYENFKGDPDFAIRSYEKYLKLQPKAMDKEEVQGWIARLR